jgi:hypothetical protein
MITCAIFRNSLTQFCSIAKTCLGSSLTDKIIPQLFSAFSQIPMHGMLDLEKDDALRNNRFGQLILVGNDAGTVPQKTHVFRSFNKFVVIQFVCYVGFCISIISKMVTNRPDTCRTAFLVRT